MAREYEEIKRLVSAHEPHCSFGLRLQLVACQMQLCLHGMREILFVAAETQVRVQDFSARSVADWILLLHRHGCHDLY